MKTILFIINPKSGKGAGAKIADAIPSLVNKNVYDYKIEITKAALHGHTLAQEAIENKIDYVIACGGDGTVNEVASALVRHNCCLGIIPLGSGNGLARHLKIPFDIKNNLQLLQTGKIIKADSMLVNNKFSINVSGAGFDAHVAALFANTKGRGFLNYVKLVLQQYKNYKPVNAKICIAGNNFERDLFLIAFANSAQFGNDFKISPAALVTDEWIDVCMVAKPSVLQTLQLAWGAYIGTFSNHKKVEIIKAKNIEIFFKTKLPIHIDGEPGGESDKINVTIQPATNYILVPHTNYDL